MLLTKTFEKIKADFPVYRFQQGDFRWSPEITTIFHQPPTSLESLWSLLHEIAHGELKHLTYYLDIELIAQEAKAWQYAKTVLAGRYGLEVDENYIEDHLDTYRAWIHQRSTCPECEQNGLQTKNTYSCLNCGCRWQANEARLCGLRRVRLRDQDQIF